MLRYKKESDPTLSSETDKVDATLKDAWTIVNDLYLVHLEKRNMLKHVSLTDEEIAKVMVRTGGDTICDVCGKNLYSHPFVSNLRDMEGHPFLNITCSGKIVKL